MITEPITPGTFVRINKDCLAGYTKDICRVYRVLGRAHFGESPEYNLRRRDGFEVLNVRRDSFSVLSPAEQVAQTLMWNDPVPKIEGYVSGGQCSTKPVYSFFFTPTGESYK